MQETGQLQAVNFEKGCYLGQEIVERVRSRAQIHRLLRKIEIDAKEPPEPGTKFQSGAEDAGEIVSAVFSPALQKVVALAYVRTRFSEPGTALALEEIPARVSSYKEPGAPDGQYLSRVKILKPCLQLPNCPVSLPNP